MKPFKSSNFVDAYLTRFVQCVTSIIDESIQVFPIEGVYGIIEVKSELSKEKLYEGLEVIKRLKLMAPKGRAISFTPMGSVLIDSPIPFGIIFAYELKDNSLESRAISF